MELRLKCIIVTLLLISTSFGIATAAGPEVVFKKVSLELSFKKIRKIIKVEQAETPEQHQHGLMFRKKLNLNEGMLFIFSDEQSRSFWMKNCHLALDMIFTRKDGTVVDVLENVPPCDADPCPSYPSKAPADTVVELTAGEAKRHGVVPGARLSFLSVPER